VIGTVAAVSLVFAAAVRSPTAATADSPASRLAVLRAAESAGHPLPSSEYARRLDEIGMSYFSSGDAARAIELLAEAVARDPDDGVALAHLTLAYLENGDLEFAEFYLHLARQSVRRDNPDPRVYVALGNVYERQNHPDDAIVAWEQAFQLGDHDPALLRKIDSARTEWAYTHGQRFYGGDRFEFFFDPEIPREEVLAIDRFLSDTEDELAEFFQAKSLPGLIVILYRGRRYFSLVDTPDWVAGFYDGKIRVPVATEGMESPGLQALLRHELAHAFLSQIGRGRAPAWLQEGLAQFLEGRRLPPAEIQKELDLARIANLSDLDRLFLQRGDRDAARRGYRLSLSFLQWLIRGAGEGAAVCLVRDLGNGREFETAFFDSFAASPDERLEEWKRDVARERLR